MSLMPDDLNWHPALDALVAAPQHHTLLFENDYVRVLDTHVAPGETVPLHAQRWAAAQYILNWSDFVRRDAQGHTLVDSRLIDSLAPGTAVWSAPLAPHTLENVGASELRVITVEQKGHSEFSRISSARNRTSVG
jgi:hypothetical protein